MVSEVYVHPGFVIFWADEAVGARHYPLPVPGRGRTFGTELQDGPGRGQIGRVSGFH
jgi:hypothetical protein